MGDLGVAAFFVVSGFVMVYAHGRDFGEPGAPARFMLRRIGRIAPFYWVVTLGYAAKLAVDGAPPSVADVARSLLFIPYGEAGDLYGRPVLGQGWTLDFEMIFYLVFAAALSWRRGAALPFMISAA